MRLQNILGHAHTVELIDHLIKSHQLENETRNYRR
jgi:hypothetical protein